MARQLQVPESDQFWPTPKFCERCGDELHKPLRSKCNSCKQEAFKEYHRNWERKNPRSRGAHLRTDCKDCGSTLQGKEETYCAVCKNQKNIAYKAKRLIENTRCRDCSGPRTGSNPYRCTDCQAKYMREWRANREPQQAEAAKKQQRTKDLLRKYGLTQEQFGYIWDKQHGRCPVCNCELVLSVDRSGNKDGHAHVDHDHKTGAVRGILCNHCNVGLGYFGDNLETVQAALNYLLAHQPHGESNG